MEQRRSKHALATLPGALTVALWAVYLLLALRNLPDLPYRVLINGSFGVLACLAALFDLRYWRSVLVLSLAVYLVTYVVLVGRMATMVTAGGTPFLDALSFYYSNSWVVTQGTFHERGMLEGIAYAFLEYAMPVLSVILILVLLASRRPHERA